MTILGFMMAISIAFATKLLRELCESQTRAEKDLGVAAASVLRQFLADLSAHECVADFNKTGLHTTFLAKSRAKIGVVLLGEVHLEFCCNHRHVPKDSEGQVDWAKVSYVQI